eukprot:SAG11_NODE_7597_length_1123_cov_3.674805_1_plen_107_part_10
MIRPSTSQDTGSFRICTKFSTVPARGLDTDWVRAVQYRTVDLLRDPDPYKNRSKSDSFWLFDDYGPLRPGAPGEANTGQKVKKTESPETFETSFGICSSRAIRDYIA